MFARFFSPFRNRFNLAIAKRFLPLTACRLRLGGGRNRGAMKIFVLLFLLFAALLVSGCGSMILDGQEINPFHKIQRGW